jgi:DinB superfamily
MGIDEIGIYTLRLRSDRCHRRPRADARGGCCASLRPRRHLGALELRRGYLQPFDVVGHLIHGEKTDWIPRLRIILERGESRPFEPFDRFAQVEESRGKSMQDLLDEFARLRASNLEVLRSLRLGAEELTRTGTHPALGRVTAGELLATWVVHDLNHVKQIAKGLSFRYRDLVGPWREYLPILTRP